MHFVTSVDHVDEKFEHATCSAYGLQNKMKVHTSHFGNRSNFKKKDDNLQGEEGSRALNPFVRKHWSSCGHAPNDEVAYNLQPI